MSNISGIDPSIVQRAMNPVVKPPAQEQTPTEAAPAQESRDVATISPLVDLIAKAREFPEVRTDLIEQVKAEIAKGDYDNPDRIEAAADGLLEDLLGDF